MNRRAVSDAPGVMGHTLGCRLNAYETEAILEEFRLRCGMRRVQDPGKASVIIVNSCAVTGRSTARSRKAVRRFLRRSEATVVVTGCVAEVTPEEFEGLDVLLVPNTGKKQLVNTVAGLLGLETEPARPSSPDALFPPCAPEIISRTRAYLKVQDGCDNRCTYCIIPSARGPSRSQPRDLVLRQAEKMAGNGFREILLTGVDLVNYGRDLYGSSYGLVELVRDLLEVGGFRLRLSSMEPIGLSTEMLEGLAFPGVCRHLHIPLQSGSDRILARMGRKYRAGNMVELLDRSLELFPGIGIGCDLITGFPGETHEDFQRTVELVKHPAVAYLHVFPFSPRPGTPAAEMGSLMVHPETVTERARFLRELSRKKRKLFRESQLGSEALVLVESRTDDNGRLMGMTDNYIPVISPLESREGDLVRMILDREDVCWEKR